MQALRNEAAVLQKRIIELTEENTFLKGEIKGLAHRKHGDDPMTTTDKLNREMERRFSGWIWLRDKVLAPMLSNIISAIVFALLILAFRSQFIK